MKKNLRLKPTSIMVACAFAATACNGGGGSSSSNPAPQPQNLPNVFDSASVQNIKIEILSLSDSYLNSIDLTKVAGHATYKIKISNPNNFAMKLTQLDFTKATTKGNYYFAKNSATDNCFNQQGYSQGAAEASLNLPANASCSLYTTSLWMGSQQASYTDLINYKLANPGFGFEIKKGKRTNLWCAHDCSPTGSSIGSNVPIEKDSINFICNQLEPSSNEIINAIPVEGFALGGDYLFTNGSAMLNKLSFTRYKVKFDDSKNQLNLGDSNNIYSNFSSSSVPSYIGFASGKAGKFITYTYKLPKGSTELLATVFQVADTVSDAFASVTGQEPTVGLQGLDNELWWNSSNYIPFYQTYLMNYPLAALSQLSHNLPASNSTILGVDNDGNMVIKTGNNINCYLKQAGYLQVPSLTNTSTFSSLADSLISSKYLYTNHATLADKYYDFNSSILATNLYYQIDARLCQAMPKAADDTVHYLVVPDTETLIISDKYTAIKTSKGYIFATTAITSDGSNNIKE